ncbi:Cycloeucalenol cycloisomerase [Apostasia shenzhenica]|uniref:5-amino-6-(5-phosphoribosylamino)uracil reductase n=1 Tax=Apostasia shenzhenica TaxID=1088818 RepID=A0A2I0AQE1_9ASPA|nr:Cycloeucalenol cycloisomerase [Apostasia shenzhenica]
MALLPPSGALPCSSLRRPNMTFRRLHPICNAVGTPQDSVLLLRAAELADRSAGLTAPHPNFGCVIAREDEVVGEGFLYAQGTKCAELQAVEAAGELARGATAYLNMEPGDCYADHTSVSSFVQVFHRELRVVYACMAGLMCTVGVSRVLVGIRHPLGHLRGKAISSLRSEGVQVEIVGEDLPSKKLEKALKCCLEVNAPLLYRASFSVPFSVLKYAMTLDGKIAASSGDASWVSSKLSRGRVFELRGKSDAIIVGGNTVRKDDPRLTARHGGGHVPSRIVMSQSLNLPEEANLWNTNDAYTIVATQRGARKDIQKKLARKGVEVVEFDILNPRDVMEYCFSRGCLSILWECGGELAASAISSSIIHKVYAFIAPKIIGGKCAPSPVGELGMVQMSQALDLIDVSLEQIKSTGDDISVVSAGKASLSMISTFLALSSGAGGALRSQTEKPNSPDPLSPLVSAVIRFIRMGGFEGKVSRGGGDAKRSFDSGSLWLAPNPSKRWGELFFLIYTPFWLTLCLGVIVPYRLYELVLYAYWRVKVSDEEESDEAYYFLEFNWHCNGNLFCWQSFNELEYLLLGLVSALPAFLIPLLLVGKADNGKCWTDRVDEKDGDAWDLPRVAVDSLGAAMLVTIILDLWRIFLGPIVPKSQSNQCIQPGLAWFHVPGSSLQNAPLVMSTDSGGCGYVVKFRAVGRSLGRGETLGRPKKLTVQRNKVGLSVEA